MLRDVFYFGKKPNAHPRERLAKSLDDARKQATTKDFWIINEFCDYKNFDWDFDFEFLPDEDVWAEDHNNVWPSVYQKDSGTWLCAKQKSDITIYRNDVQPLKRKNEKNDNWVLHDLIDETKFDFGWHPDPTDPPYIYKWGSKFYPAQFQTVLEYRVPNATDVKYMDTIVELLPQYERWVENHKIDRNKFDLSWRPDPMDPPYIYVWGNPHIDPTLESTLEYHTPGATDKKYMPEKLVVLPQYERWTQHVKIDESKFDLSWRPDPREPAFNYVWGNKYEPGEIKPTLEYNMPGATQVKYMTDPAPVLPQWDRWIEHTAVDKTKFDFSWRPDPREPAYNYVWGNKYEPAEITPTLEYRMPNATDVKYMSECVDVLPQTERWTILDETVDKDKFDFSWRPDPREPAFIYTWGNKWVDAEMKPTIEYHMPGATERKYMGNDVAMLPQWDRWIEHTPVDKKKSTKNGFDFSWRPDPREPAYNYVWGNKYEPAEITPTLEYRMPGATEIKYMPEHVEVLPQWDRWIEHTPVDKLRSEENGFDFSWRPDPREPAFNYVWGNKFEDAEMVPTLEYRMADATQVKYMTERVDVLPQWDRWTILEEVVKSTFDFSWRPDPREPALIYVFGNELYDGTIMPTIEYRMEGATEKKYINHWTKPTLKPNKKLFEFLEDSDGLDYSWRPNPTSPPYIYAWGNQWNKPEDKVSVQYVVEGATEYKYMSERAIRKHCMDNWIIPSDVDVTGFDFSWEPSPADPAYIYEFGTQWQKTGGPQYVVPGATQVKYVDIFKVKKLPSKANWTIPKNVDVTNFDFSWHPDDTSPPYIYHFATQWATSGGPIYTVSGATEVKYIDDQVAKMLPDKTNWEYDSNLIDDTTFDFSWHPYVEDQPYIYVFGTQWQKTGGPRYITPGCHKNSPVKYIDTRILKATRKPCMDNWVVLDNLNVIDFDYSWHPDDTEEAYIYQFGNNQYPAEIMPTIEYAVQGAKQFKYVHDIVATLGPDKTNWEIPDNIDDTGFDYSWKPNPKDPSYIYEFGTQWQKTGGPRYVTYRATEVKYIDTQKVKRLESKDNWTVPSNCDITGFDFSWHPDDTSPPYVYYFPTQWALSGGPVYTVPGATEVKYVEDQTAIATVDKTNWIVPNDIDADSFDFSWHPYVDDQPYIYQFGTQWQKTGGPRYVTPGCHKNSPVKYIDTRILKAKKKSSIKNWEIPDNLDVKDFDFSWHPDDTEEPFIYQFGTQWQKTGGPRYVVHNAKSFKYIDIQKAKHMPSMDNWDVPAYVDVDSFDFSWHPDDTGEPYNYVFPTEYQQQGGPVYKMHGADSEAYLNHPIAKTKPQLERWEIPNNVDLTDFKLNWHPHPKDPPYIYQFGTQWQKTGGPKYIVEGATEVKYLDISKVKVLPNKKNWQVMPGLKVADFDYSWHPDSTEEPYIYVFGNTQYSAESMPTIKYVVPGATELKYVHDIVAKLAPNKKNWHEIIPIDKDEFDYSWIPDPNSPPYIYVFGNQWNRAELESTVEYRVPGATEYTYVQDIVAKVKPNKKNWKITGLIDESKFDFSWRPNPKDPEYIYQFGTQHQKTGGPRYIVKGATQIKYVEDIKAVALPNKKNWEIPDNLDIADFDFSWHPDDTDPPYIYQYGTQWALTGGPRYVVPGATNTKYVEGVVAKVGPNMQNWEVPDDIAVKEFDFSWHPYAEDEPFIYQFGTQHQKTGGPRYVVPGATKVKYIDKRILKARKLTRKSNWRIPAGINTAKFDFSWHPDDTAPPYIYQFGTIEDPIDGPKYLTPNNNGETVYLNRIELSADNVIEEPKHVDYPKYHIVTTLEDLIEEHPTEIFWAMSSEVDYTSFDFDWRPNIEQAQYVHVFGQSESIKSQTYFVNAVLWYKGFKEFNFVEEQVQKKVNDLDMFFVDRGNPEAQKRFDTLKARYPKLQKTRYLNSWVDTVNRCCNRASSTLLWVLNSELDYTNFNFEYYPNPWQTKMVHVFGTQWSHWGTTFMVNRETFSVDTKYIKIIEHLSNLNFVKEIKAFATKCTYDIVLIDHGNKQTNDIAEYLKTKSIGDVSTFKYDTSYLNTLKQIVNKLPAKKEHYIWICSSVCDYKGFDFSYIIDPFSRDNLHVFPSEKQKFGDTFFVDVNKLRELISSVELLENYKVNYNQAQRATRLPAPVVVVNEDTHSNAVNYLQDFPYTVLVSEDNKDIDTVEVEPMSLWDPSSKNIIVTSVGATKIIVPTEIKDHVKTQLYDYPYIKKSSKLAMSTPLDIVFLSNGETGAEENYEHLLKITKGLKNRVVRVDGVNGRVQAYHASAVASNTPWAFTVFAKLKVSAKFDFNWQPDRMQIPKHYVFQAKNPVNGLIYGHQAMIAYNKNLTLKNEGLGLDFTMDDPHEVVELLSGVANYNTDAFSTWRTAFREVIKLQWDRTEISDKRLETWISKAEGEYAQYSLDGARDALAYYSEVQGQFDKLKLSYEWEWLKNYFNNRYK